MYMYVNGTGATIDPPPPPAWYCGIFAAQSSVKYSAETEYFKLHVFLNFLCLWVGIFKNVLNLSS